MAGLSNYEVALLVVFIICCFIMVYQLKKYQQKSLVLLKDRNKQVSIAMYHGASDGIKEWLDEKATMLPATTTKRLYKKKTKKRK